MTQSQQNLVYTSPSRKWTGNAPENTKPLHRLQKIAYFQLFSIVTFFLPYISILAVGVVLFIQFIFKSKKVNCSFSLLPCTKKSIHCLYEGPKGSESFVLGKKLPQAIKQDCWDKAFQDLHQGFPDTTCTSKCRLIIFCQTAHDFWIHLPACQAE